MRRRGPLLAVLLAALGAASLWLNLATRVQDPSLSNDREVFDHLPGMLRTADGAIAIPAPAREPRLDIGVAELVAELHGQPLGAALQRLGDPDHRHHGNGRVYTCWWSVARGLDPDFPDHQPVVHLVALSSSAQPAGTIREIAVLGSGGHRLDTLAPTRVATR